MQGKAEAYKMLYDRYSAAMYNTALRIVGKVADAEDVLQEAFTDAFMQLKTFEQKSTFGAWLKQIVIFKSINLLKKQKLAFAELNENVHDAIDEQGINEEEVCLQ
jgi:RNA polymerase sigma factor (sigma-70 family)